MTTASHFPLKPLLALTVATAMLNNCAWAASSQTAAEQPSESHVAAARTESYNHRDLIVYVPSSLPARGTRALVVVLHGGLGNASRIERGASESGLNMNDVAEKDGFIVAYLNGTSVTRMYRANMLGWNAGGGCCGVPAETNVDDVAYITGAVHHLEDEYGVDPRRVYGIGHSNGGMMTMRLVCETHLYVAAISISGPLNLDVRSCPTARGTRVLAIHGAD
ncbi:MAG: PHB depolymerase family esterase, partial [Acidobacteriaceae bacterium]